MPPSAGPWIDWIHTARDQGALVRDYTKWDDQPASPAAAREALMRAWFLAHTAPKGPIYVNLDAEMQEAKLAEPLAAASTPRASCRRSRARPPPSMSRKAAALLKAAKNIVILIGRVSRSEDAGMRASPGRSARRARHHRPEGRRGFPTDHPLHLGAPRCSRPTPKVAALGKADVILSLDWVDLAGTLRPHRRRPRAPRSSASRSTITSTMAGAWTIRAWRRSMCCSRPIPTRRPAADRGARRTRRSARPPPSAPNEAQLGRRPAHRRASRARAARRGRQQARARSRICRSRGTARGGRSAIRSTSSAPTAAAGSAAAPASRSARRWRCKGSGRLAVGICGDGDFLMGVTALWTAAHYRIPLLIVVANNRSFYNDEVHQERVARMRNRPVENKWIGQRISDPDIDLAALARAQGARRLRADRRRRQARRRRSPKPSRRWSAARSRSSTCASSRATRPP